MCAFASATASAMPRTNAGSKSPNPAQCTHSVSLTYFRPASAVLNSGIGSCASGSFGFSGFASFASASPLASLTPQTSAIRSAVASRETWTTPPREPCRHRSASYFGSFRVPPPALASSHGQQPAMRFNA